MDLIQTVTGFFDEDLNVRSMTRLLSFISMIDATIAGILTIVMSAGTFGIVITALFLVGAFVPKSFQKILENRYFLRMAGISPDAPEVKQQNEVTATQ